MRKSGRKRKPSRKASMALESLNTNSFENRRSKKSLRLANLAIDVQEQNNEKSAIAWANDKNSNDDSRKENM